MSEENKRKSEEALERIRAKKFDNELPSVDLSKVGDLKFKEGAEVKLGGDIDLKDIKFSESRPRDIDALELIGEILHKTVEAKKPSVVADAKEKMEGKEICEVFQARIDALKKVNPKDCGDDTILRAGALVAQDYLTEVKPVPTDKVDYDKMADIEKRYIAPDWVHPLEVADLMSGFLADVKNGVIDEKGNIIGDLKKSKIMDVFHIKEANLPKKALTSTVNTQMMGGRDMTD